MWVTIAVGVLLALVGIALVAVGLGLFVVFRLGLRMFDQSLATEFAGETKEQIERAAMRIKNALVRRFVLNYVVASGSAVAVSMVRNGLQSRMRTGLWTAIAGAVVLLGAFFTGKWLPLVWSGVASYVGSS
jgi:hypothetical protein